MAARQRWTAWGGLIALVLGLAVVGGEASAQPGSSGGPGVTGQAADPAAGDLPDVAPLAMASGPNDAELEDLRTIARQEDIPLDRAIARYAWNDNFTAAVEEIRAITDELAEAVITRDGKAWVAFAEDEPAGVSALLGRFDTFHPTVEVEVRTGAGYTQAALESAIARVHRSIYAEPGVADAVTTYDRASRQIVTAVSLLPDADPDVVSDLQSLSAARLVTDGDRGIEEVISTKVVRHDGRLTRDESSSYHYGGEDITGCTSGFAVRRLSDNSRGIAFAEHCDGTIYDDGDKLTYRDSHNGTHGDMEWRYGPDYEVDDFYAGNGSATEVNRRDVSGYATPVEGQTLCFNGKTTHKHCQQVRKVSVCSNGSCHLVQMGEHSTDNGDSGGPWFYGNTAYGIHKGSQYDPFWPYDRSVFTKVTRLDDGLGVVVATW